MAALVVRGAVAELHDALLLTKPSVRRLYLL